MKNSFVTGAAIPRVVLKDFKRTTIRLPPLPVQQKIASILCPYDDLIENNTRRIKILEEMAHMVYQEWFVYFLFPGHEQVRMVDSEAGKIPEGWMVKPLKQLCSLVQYGFTAKARQEPVGPKFLRITDIVPHLIDWDHVPYCAIAETNLDKYLLKEGDIVIARTGATVGYAKRIDSKAPKSIFASYLVRVRVQPEYDDTYIGLILESDEYKRFVKSNMGGAAQPNANAQVLASFSVLVPSKNVQNKFREIISDLFNQRAILRKRIANLRQTRDLLLPKLISGEIDVEAGDTDIGSEHDDGWK
jgi:type I restriction enzyme S subunit